MIALHPVKRATKASNRFCGPSAISILTGLDTADTARLLRSISGRRLITGTSEYEMREALSRLGFVMLQAASYGDQPAKQRPTLAQWVRANPARGTATYLMSVGHHWAVVQGRRYACGIVRKPVPLKGCIKWRARVRRIWTVQLTKTGIMKDAIPAKPAVPPRDPDIALAKELAAYHGIQLESVSGFARLDPVKDGVYVYPPIGLYDDDGEDDPLNGERIGYSWGEVLENVRVYVEAIKTRESTLSTAAAQPATV